MAWLVGLLVFQYARFIADIFGHCGLTVGHLVVNNFAFVAVEIKSKTEAVEQNSDKFFLSISGFCARSRCVLCRLLKHCAGWDAKDHH